MGTWIIFPLSLCFFPNKPMTSLRLFLKDKKYTRIKLKTTLTGHYKMELRLNGVAGEFILDTGASNTCLDFNAVETFKLFAENSEIKAAGAGAIDMLTKLSTGNSIDINGWKNDNINVVLFDLSHVNTALIDHNIGSVDGILGADVLKMGKAIIDYQYNCLYLKKNPQDPNRVINRLEC